MSEEVEHIATITSIHAGSITVELSPGRKCSGCGVAAMCGSKGEKLVLNLKVRDASAFSLGERVRLFANERSTWWSICIGLVMPSLLLCVAVIGLLAAGMGELAVACVGVAVVVVYYVTLYMFRNRVVDRLSWTIEKLERRQDL